MRNRVLPRLLGSFALLLVACSAGAPSEESASSTSAIYAGDLLTPTRVAQVARGAGVPCGDRLVLAVAVAFGESEGYTRASHYNVYDGSVDRGLWQINSKAWPMYGESCVYDPACNAKAMVAISNGGASWSPWLAYTNGRYAQFMARAREGAAAACGANGPTTPSTPNAPGAPGGTAGTGATSCADLGYEGRCFGSTLAWVENGTCLIVDCAARNKTCGPDGANGNNCK